MDSTLLAIGIEDGKTGSLVFKAGTVVSHVLRELSRIIIHGGNIDSNWPQPIGLEVLQVISKTQVHQKTGETTEQTIG